MYIYTHFHIWLRQNGNWVCATDCLARSKHYDKFEFNYVLVVYSYRIEMIDKLVEFILDEAVVTS